MNDDEDADLQRALAMSLQHNQISSQTKQEPTVTSLLGDTIGEHDDDDDEDADLAAALQLSLQNDDGDNNKNKNNNYINDEGNTIKTNESLNLGSVAPMKFPDSNLFSSRVLRCYQSATPTIILNCHALIWDTEITTRNDQRRWLAQAIDFKSQSAHPDAHPGAKESLLAAIICHSELWGLTQAHGGPCGVLASLQAELMRLLLFGPRISDGLLPVHVPTQLTNHFCQAKPDLSPTFLTSALALSIGIVLARAALQPSAACNDDSNSSSQSVQDNDEPLLIPVQAKLVFPRPSSTSIHQLEWQHLEPWPSDNIMGSGTSEYLVTYTISLEDSRDTTKRQKRLSTTNDEREELLAQAVAEFLLETQLIQWYHRQGGVLLFLLALVESRGPANIQADMDDPTARLTSQFGHCSQELINLLLTGQSVSNVFDHTLRPSGELICRGIQKRPVIGYLTQLESMRYLEVGGYYKSPEFPIWVVGSTSHFTVLFGDASCLKESASDRILERVRRAFKQMDGGEEQGFIQLDQLGDFLRKLDLYDKLGDHGVQTLGATMEVAGAGILLWEDVWKRVSRLLTGASLETVLNVDEDMNDSGSPHATMSSSVQPHHAPLVPATQKPLSDEEYARQLQAEWNGQDFPTPNPIPTPQGQGSSPSNPQQQQQQQGKEFGTTFQLYHYNGLRGGTMKPFRVTRLSSEEAIGASVSLGASSSQGNIGSSNASDGGLEDVLRTKWPSCKIDWLNGSPPSID